MRGSGSTKFGAGTADEAPGLFYFRVSSAPLHTLAPTSVIFARLKGRLGLPYIGCPSDITILGIYESVMTRIILLVRVYDSPGGPMPVFGSYVRCKYIANLLWIDPIIYL